MNNKQIRPGKFPPTTPARQEDSVANSFARGLEIVLVLLGSAIFTSACLSDSAPSAIPLMSLLLESTTAMTGPFVLPLVMNADGGTLGMLLLGLIGTACVAHIWSRSKRFSRPRSLLACLCWSGTGAILMQPIFS